MRFPTRMFVVASACLSINQASYAQRDVDILDYFKTAQENGRTGLARKTKLVNARRAKVGEVVITVIAGEGKETQSPPARAGDVVVRNRCPESGNEQFLVAAAKFAQRYEGPIDIPNQQPWQAYRPRGEMRRYVVVSAKDGAFSFDAPWGEKMVARPGDAIVQDLKDEKDTYRVAAASFRCSYELVAKSKN